MRPTIRSVLTIALPLSIVVSWLQVFQDSSRRWKAADTAAFKKQSSARRRDEQDFHVLPRRLITVFGLESSGTSLLASTLANAVGAHKVLNNDDLVYRASENNMLEIQHLSLPWGWFHGVGKKNLTVVDIDFIPPLECMVYPHHHAAIQRQKEVERPHSHCDNETGLSERVRLPQRFMVNITSHVLWYRERGVQATALVIVREDYSHWHGKIKTHEKNVTIALQEDLHAKQLIAHAMSHLSSLPTSDEHPELIVVSYETLMSLQKPYLFDLYSRLGINSTHMPKLENGNKKYIQPPEGTEHENWRTDPGKSTILARR